MDEYTMAGSKHSRFESFEGSGSPLAAKLQEAWLKTQMPKVQKLNYMALSSTPSQSSRLSASSGPIPEQSALKSLSAIFPELVDMPEEKKPLIFSVFEDGEEQTLMSPDLRQKKADCLQLLFEGIEIEKPRLQASKPSGIRTSRSISAPLMEQPTEPNMPVRNRLISAPLVEWSSASSDVFTLGALSSAHSFAASQQAHVNDSFTDTDIWSGMNVAPASTDIVDLDDERSPLFSYLSKILMDENVDDNKCMFMEVSAYQAMAMELGDLISDDSPFPPAFRSICTGFTHEEVVGRTDTWIEEMLSGPVPAELEDSHGTEKGYGSKFGSHLNDFVTHTGSASGSSGGYTESGSWENGRDSGSEVTEARVPYLPMPSLTHADALYSRHKDSALKNYSLANPVLASASGNGVYIPSSSPVPPVDLRDLLIRCAEAVDQSDYRYANELIGELRQHSSAYGNWSQRMAHYFMEALVARISGTGAQLYNANSFKRPSESEMLKGFKLLTENCPFIQMAHCFANFTLLDVFEGASRVHVVDYGILYGVQWPCLIHMLSRRPGGPPHLRLTGIDRPQPGFRPSARIQETGRRLAKLAKAMGVPFEFHAIAEKWEAITPAHLLLRGDEVLAVNCMYRLPHVLDESVTAASPREMLLRRIRSMNPKVFVQGILSAGFNAPFFKSRFREGLDYFSTLYDAMEVAVQTDSPGRFIVDRDFWGRQIMNIVACEGLERVERPETYRHWQSRTSRAGFQQMPISQDTKIKLRQLMKRFNRNYGIGEDGYWFLMGWKNRISHVLGAWEPSSVSP